MATLGYEPFPENTPAGKAFQEGYDKFVQAQHRGDVFWDPVDSRWETYPAAGFTFAKVGIPRVDPGTNYFSERNTLHEVLNLGRAVKALNTKIIWGPRDGYWYAWANRTQPPPPPPPEPDWLKRLNANLDALDRNTRLTPEERRAARSALIQAAYGQPH